MINTATHALITAAHSWLRQHSCAACDAAGEAAVAAATDDDELAASDRCCSHAKAVSAMIDSLSRPAYEPKSLTERLFGK